MTGTEELVATLKVVKRNGKIAVDTVYFGGRIRRSGM